MMTGSNSMKRHIRKDQDNMEQRTENMCQAGCRKVLHQFPFVYTESSKSDHT